MSINSAVVDLHMPADPPADPPASKRGDNNVIAVIRGLVARPRWSQERPYLNIGDSYRIPDRCPGYEGASVATNGADRRIARCSYRPIGAARSAACGRSHMGDAAIAPVRCAWRRAGRSGLPARVRIGAGARQAALCPQPAARRPAARLLWCLQHPSAWLAPGRLELGRGAIAVAVHAMRANEGGCTAGRNACAGVNAGAPRTDDVSSLSPGGEAAPENVGCCQESRAASSAAPR
jgi:hypothetical protein